MPVPAPIATTLAKLPTRPGVYVFRDQRGQVLYVGKAKSLRSRVRSYFRASTQLEPSKRLMVGRIADLEYTIVDSETEALLLEATLIKRDRPPFNVIFRDDKYYQYIRLTLNDDYPRVETVRRIAKDGSRSFGPFTSGYAVRQTLRLLKRIFPYKSCDQPPSKPCFDARLGRCLGHDTGPGSRERYRAVVRSLIRFLEGDVRSVVRDLRLQMRTAAQRRDFEQAARLRDRIRAIEQLTAEQKVVSTRLEDEDALGLARVADLALVVRFPIRTGRLLGRQSYILEHVADQSDVTILSSFISQFYPASTDHPRTVVTREPPDDTTGLRRGLGLRFESPTRGRRRKLVALAEANARDELNRKQREWLSREARARLGLEELRRALDLPRPLHRLECYDVSNVQGTHAVGSMVVFADGQPRRSDYRKFRIQTVVGSNDYAMLQEILRRRFAHHDAASDAGWPAPDLVIIDGGKGQLNVALAVLRELNLKLPAVALAKRQEELFRPDRPHPLRLPNDSEGLFLLQRIRDEAHRFAIGTYRQRHARATTRSRLDDVPGIGPRTKHLLLERFGTLDGIRAADDAELERLVGRARARRLRDHL